MNCMKINLQGNNMIILKKIFIFMISLINITIISIGVYEHLSFQDWIALDIVLGIFSLAIYFSARSNKELINSHFSIVRKLNITIVVGIVLGFLWHLDYSFWILFDFIIVIIQLINIIFCFVRISKQKDLNLI